MIAANNLMFGRNYNIIDVDAYAFILAAGITNSTQQTSIDKLVKDLKIKGLWGKLKAIYPFIGGSAFSHKWNLKDPRDLDIAYRIIFSGTVFHDSNGITGGGGEADTKLIPYSNLINNNTHVSIYSRTNIAGNYVDIGCENTGGGSTNSRIATHLKWSDNNGYFDMYAQNNGRVVVPGIASSIGFSITSRISSTDLKVYSNGLQIGTRTTMNSNSLPTNSIYLMKLNNGVGGSFPSFRNYAFSSIGDGLNASESLEFYNTVQIFQASLGRQV